MSYIHYQQGKKSSKLLVSHEKETIEDFFNFWSFFFLKSCFVCHWSKWLNSLSVSLHYWTILFLQSCLKRGIFKFYQKSSLCTRSTWDKNCTGLNLTLDSASFKWKYVVYPEKLGSFYNALLSLFHLLLYSLGECDQFTLLHLSKAMSLIHIKQLWPR